MQDRDLVPLAAWIMWEVFFDEPEPTNARRKDDQGQMQLFADTSKELLSALAAIGLEALTPLQAFELLREWKEKFTPR